MGNTQAKTKGKTASAGIKLMHSSNEQSNVLLFGLEGAGKTHMLYRRLAGNTLDHSYENQELQQTKGFNCEQLLQNYGSFLVWDIGGSDTIREFWPFYSSNIYASIIVFVINVNECIERIRESKRVLHWLLNDPCVQQAQLMIVLNNKQNKLKNKNQLYVEQPPHTKKFLIDLLKLMPSDKPENREKRDHLFKFYKDQDMDEIVYEFDVNNDLKCNEFFEKVAFSIQKMEKKNKKLQDKLIQNTVLA